MSSVETHDALLTEETKQLIQQAFSNWMEVPLEFKSSMKAFLAQDESFQVGVSQVYDLKRQLAAAAATTMQSINPQTGTAYTLALADNLNWVELLNAAAITLTLPTDASVAIPVGGWVNLAQTGAGQVTIAAAGGVTLNGTPGFKIAAQWGVATVFKRAANSWLAFGNLVP